MGSLASVVAGCVLLCDMPVHAVLRCEEQAATSLITMLPISQPLHFISSCSMFDKKAESQAYKTLPNCCTSCKTICTYRVLNTYGNSRSKGIITVEGEEIEERDGNEGYA